MDTLLKIIVVIMLAGTMSHAATVTVQITVSDGARTTTDTQTYGTNDSDRIITAADADGYDGNDAQKIMAVVVDKFGATAERYEAAEREIRYRALKRQEAESTPVFGTESGIRTTSQVTRVRGDAINERP